ncbi:MAG: RNA polymerase sigma factor [Pirellula sp.]
MASNTHPFPSNKLPDRPFDAELAEWIRGAALGDQESQKKIYQRIAAQIVRIVRRIVGQDHVDDVVQDFFVTLFAKISQFRFESSFETWVHRMAVNQSLQHLRKASREQERIRQYAGDGAVRSIPKDESSSREDAEVLEIAMNHLSGDQRALLHMKEVEGFGYQQIAEVLGVPEGTVGSRLNKARSELRSALTQLGWEG